MGVTYVFDIFIKISRAMSLIYFIIAPLAFVSVGFIDTHRQWGFWDRGSGTPAGSQSSPPGTQTPVPERPINYVCKIAGGCPTILFCIEEICMFM